MTKANFTAKAEEGRAYTSCILVVSSEDGSDPPETEEVFPQNPIVERYCLVLRGAPKGQDGAPWPPRYAELRKIPQAHSLTIL